MHIHIVPNRKSAPTILLRETYREGKKVGKRTLANLSSLSMEQVEGIRAILRGETLRPVSEVFEIISSRAHGHVQAVSQAMQRLGLASLIAAQPCHERDVVLAMVASRVLAPHPKLSTTRWWKTTTVSEDFGVEDATEDDLYGAMDWLLEQQEAIQKKLAKRHLREGGMALYDLSSSYFEGTHCPLAKLGYSRDGKKGTLQVNYGLLTDSRGCPVAISVYEGKPADPDTFLPEVARLKKSFGLDSFVLVADQGMIAQKAIDAISTQEGVGWITALKSGAIRALIEDKSVQPQLFDARNLFEISHADYPGERLIACRNPELAKRRAHKREELLQATEKTLEEIQNRVDAGRLAGQDKIGLKVGGLINRYKMAKHFSLTIKDKAFSFQRKQDGIAAEAALDGITIVRTSMVVQEMDSASCVRSYKLLANVERAFRSLKTVDLKIRPIHHRLETRVRAHIFLCMLAYYVEWHMLQAWRTLMFADEDLGAKATRDPVAPAKRSESALYAKIQTKQLDDETPAHSFSTLLAELATIVRNTCRIPTQAATAPDFQITTTPSPKQQAALALIQAITL